MSNNIFTRNSSQGNNNIFTNNNNNSQNNNGNNTNQNSQANNIFGNRNSQSSNIFTNNNSNNNNNSNSNNSGNNPFNRGNQTSNNIFNQNNQSRNILNNNGNQGNSIFNNNNNSQGNIFTNNNNQQGNIFNNNNGQNNNIFNNNQRNNTFNNSQYNNQQSLFQQPLFNINFNMLNPDQQAQIMRNLTTDQIRRLIKHFMSNLIDNKKIEMISLSQQNSLRKEKVNKLANNLNIKREILYIKKQLKDNVVSPIQQLKAQDQKLVKSSKHLLDKLSEKLLSYKQKLIEVVTQQKIVKEIKGQLQQIDTQIQDFLKPLLNSYTNNSSFTFIDPDPFCIKISERILKNITHLDNQIDQILAIEEEIPEESVSITNTIQQLIQYYENVASSLHQFTIHYNIVKKEALAKRSSNASAALDKITKKAKDAVDAELQAYKLIKQIEDILHQRSNSMINNK